MSWIPWASAALALASLLFLVVPGVVFLVTKRVPSFWTFMLTPTFRARSASAEKVRLVGWHNVSFGTFWCLNSTLIWSPDQGGGFPNAGRVAIVLLLALSFAWAVRNSRKLRAGGQAES